MKSSRIILAAAAIILLSSLFSGCGQKEESNPVHEAAKQGAFQLIQNARNFTKEVEMKLDSSVNGDQVTVRITLDNPKEKPITSVQSWLSYNTKALKGNRIIVNTSPFVFTAPYANTFDEEMGLVMIGRSNNEPISSKTIVVAEVVFDLLTDDTTMVDIYDYKSDISGHASANMMYEGAPYNILKKPESPALVINN